MLRSRTVNGYFADYRIFRSSQNRHSVITMSHEELTRLRVLIDIADGRLSVADATGLIGVGPDRIDADVERPRRSRARSALLVDDVP